MFGRACADNFKLLKEPADGLERNCYCDTAGFEEWLKYHRQAFYKTAWAILQTPEDAADAVQDSWVKLLKHHRDFRGNANFRTYVMRIVINTSCNMLRKRRLFEKYCRIYASEVRVPEPVEILEKKFALQRLADALSSLPPLWSEVIYLRYIAGLSYRQISAAMNCSCGTVKSRLYRAKRHLKKKLIQKNG